MAGAFRRSSGSVLKCPLLVVRKLAFSRFFPRLVIILDPVCSLVDLREKCAFVDANIAERLSNTALLALRNGELRFFNLVWKKPILGRIETVNDEGARLRQNSPVAHLGMNIIRHK